MISRRLIACAALLGSASSLIAHADPAPLTAQTAVVVPGGPGGFDWMAVDAARHRLYATHPGKGTLVVYDLKAGTVQQIDTDGAVNGEAVDEADNKLFVAGANQKVVVFDLKTLAKKSEIPVTGPADSIAFDPKNGTLYVDHDDGTEVWTIDGKTEQVTGAVTVAGAPEALAYDPMTDRLYQNIKPANVTQVIDPAINKVEATWPTTPMTSPHGLAIDSKTKRVFAAGQGKVVMMDQATGKALSSVEIAPGYVDQIALDPDKGRLYCACGDAGVISVVQETDAGMTLLGNVPSHHKAHTLAVDPETHGVWVSYSDDKDAYLQQFTLPSDAKMDKTQAAK